MKSYKLKPDEYYQMHGGTSGTHCRRCNEVLNDKKIVTLYMRDDGGWATDEQPDDSFGEEFGSACAKAALQGR